MKTARKRHTAFGITIFLSFLVLRVSRRTWRQEEKRDTCVGASKKEETREDRGKEKKRGRQKKTAGDRHIRTLEVFQKALNISQSFSTRSSFLLFRASTNVQPCLDPPRLSLSETLLYRRSAQRSRLPDTFVFKLLTKR